MASHAFAYLWDRLKKRQMAIDSNSPWGSMLMGMTPGALNASFKAVQRVADGTTIITQPESDETSIRVYDIIITTDKTNATSATIQFTDGTNTVVIAKGDSTNAPVNLAIAFNGRVQGWGGARLELVTVGAVTANAMATYEKISKEFTDQSFEEWDKKR